MNFTTRLKNLVKTFEFIKSKNLADLTLFLLLFILTFPISAIQETVTNNHFFSSIHLFEYKLRNESKFANQFIDNVGPLGTFHYPYLFSGEFFWLKILYGAVLSFAFSYLSISFIIKFKSFLWKTSVILILSISTYSFMNPWYGFEAIPFLIICMIFVKFSLLKPNFSVSFHNGKFLQLSLIFLLAVLSLTKFTNFVLIMANTAILFLYSASKKQLIYFLRFFLLYLFFLLLIWIGLGQDLLEIKDFILSRFSLLSAYEATQLIQFPETLFIPLFSILVAFLLFSIVFIVNAFNEPKSCFPMLISAYGYVFATFLLTFKHSIARGEGSFGILVSTFFGLAFLLLLISSSQNFAFSGIFLISVLGLYLSFFLSTSFKGEIENRLSFYNVLLAPDYKERFVDDYSNFRLEMKIPDEYLGLIGKQSIDELGNTPEIILTNNLNYSPRPIPMSTLVGNVNFMNRNYSFYSDSTTAPEFVLLDNLSYRFEDGKAFLRVLNSYSIVGQFSGYYLMQQTHLDDPMIDIFYKRDPARSDFVNTSPNRISIADSSCWMNLNLKENFFEKIRNSLYAPTKYRMRLNWGDGTFTDGYLTSSQLSAGFSLRNLVRVNEFIKGERASYRNATSFELIRISQIGIYPENSKFQYTFEFCDKS